MKDIDAERSGGHFVNTSGDVLPGDEEIGELLGKITLWAEIVLER